ncbi:MAG: DUF1990 domain-containing protein [Myxococcota bacterium]|nr:DUF1990 domain-containing protein [Deltaproteobacteria bacterium]MDQ3341354.1 DUF1990 domain-containing protein [Myxococcota bacterium]
MISLARPPAAELVRFLDAQRALPFTYEAVGHTRDEQTPRGYAIDHNRVRLGSGAQTFTSAQAQVRAWRMFPPWTAIAPLATPIEEGRVLAVLVNAFGVWFKNAARIVYVIDEPGRFGFAYGTLPGHAERGEERFLVEHLADDSVWYDVRAFSQPRYWGARLAYPITRMLQKRFGRDSKASMLRALR